LTIDEEDFKMSYMAQDDKSITMKVSANVKVDLFNFLSIIYEVDLYKKWVPFCHDSETVLYV